MEILELGLADSSNEINKIRVMRNDLNPGFWRRQFKTEHTKRQMVFDWIFGVIMPVICAMVDPLVFSGNGGGKGALLGGIKPFAFLLSYASIMAMAAWLIWGKKLGWLCPLLSGLFGLGGIISMAIGLLLFPLSLIGIFFLIGILGFTPFLTSFVYFRNTVRAYEAATPHFSKSSRLGAFVFSAITSFTIPMLFNIEASKTVETMRTGDVATINRTKDRIRYFAPLMNFDRLAGHYCEFPESEEQKALESAYLELTGRSMRRIDYGICYDA